jgi:alcohol dehydrogenase
MSTYTIDRSPVILAGDGALAELAGQLRRLGAARVLLVSDQGMVAARWVGRLETLLAADCPVVTFIAPPGEPNVRTVDEGAIAARRLGAGTTVVGLGGGTALDIAKLAAAAAVSDRPAGDYIMCRHPFAGRLPTIMIPSTSGTGAEVTRTCVLTDAAGRKSWAWGEELCPDVALLEPAVTTTLPPTLTAATGLDAYAHAVEAATGQRANAFAQAFALQAIRLIVTSLPVAVREPENLAARQRMLEAACLAGMAINQCGTGIAHNIGHALGTAALLPHAVAVTVAMESSYAWNVEGAPAAYTAVADAMRPGATSCDLPALFAELLAATDFAAATAPYRYVNVRPEVLLSRMLAEENLPMLRNNARVPDRAAIEALAGLTVTTWQRYTGQLV